MFGIMNRDTFESVNPTSLFGKEANKVNLICNAIKSNKLDGHGIKHPAIAALHEDGLTLMDVIKSGYSVAEWRNEYAEDHPDEMENYKAKINAWNYANNKLFRQLYGIAKRYHLRIEWDGHSTACCCPDRFTVYKNGQRYLIQC